jgi:hypothetical protein
VDAVDWRGHTNRNAGRKAYPLGFSMQLERDAKRVMQMPGYAEIAEAQRGLFRSGLD